MIENEFDAIDRMYKSQWYHFFKISKRQYLEDIRLGKLYMKNLQFFVDLEEKYHNVGQGDKGEASLINIKKHELFINGKKVPIGAAPGVIRDEDALKKPVFCLWAYNIAKDIIYVENKNFQHKYTYNIKVDEKWCEDFNEEYVLWIWDSYEFIMRIKKALRKRHISGERGMVTYRDKSKPNICNGKLIMDDSFTKDISFQHQNEFRILLNKEIKDHYVLNVGSIKDISQILKIDTLKRGVVLEYLIEHNAPHVKRKMLIE